MTTFRKTDATTAMAEETRSVAMLVREQQRRQGGDHTHVGEALRAFDPAFVATCARGSSDGAATYLNYLCGLLLGLPVASVGPSIASVYGASLRLGRAAAIAISQSGRSPDLVSFQDMAREAGAFTLSVVNTPGSPLASAAAHVVDIGAGEERSVAATKSFVCSLTSVASLIAAWSGDEDLRVALSALPDALDEALSLDWSGAADSIANSKSLYVVGRGPGLAVAQEAALKFKETCQLHAESYSSAEVMHGPIQLAAGDLGALVFLTRDAARQGMVEAIARMARSGVRVHVVDPANERAMEGGHVSMLPCAPAPHPLLDPVCQIASFYVFVEELARRRGFDPDAPPLLRKVTETV